MDFMVQMVSTGLPVQCDVSNLNQVFVDDFMSNAAEFKGTVDDLDVIDEICQVENRFLALIMFDKLGK